MKIAVPIEGNEQIAQHFGHSESYMIYEITEDRKIDDKESLITSTGHVCNSNVGGLLADIGITVMLAGGIGAGAVNKLEASGIKTVRGCSGNASEAVELYITGKITDSGESCSTHDTHHADGHHHDDGHTCNH